MKRLIGVLWREDTAVIAVAIFVAIASWSVFYSQGSTLGFKDVFSHLEIGRRIVAGQSTGFGQLGGIWLPLPHLLMIPLAWSKTLYLTGMSGSIVSMAAYVVSVWVLYRLVLHITHRRAAALVGATIFGLNPDMLYLQSTPMGETLMYMTMLLALLGLVRWAQTDRYQYLLLASVSVLALTLVRYEGWVMALALIGVVAYVCIRKGYPLVRDTQKGQGLILAFAFLPAIGIGGWMLWNRLIFGDWLNWLHGQYSAKQQVSDAVYSQVGNWGTAAATYWYAMVHILTIPLVGLMLVGLVVMLAKEKLSPLAAITLSTLVPGAFFVYGLYSGSQPMQITEIDGSLFNARFGVVMLIPASIFVSYLVAQLPSRFWVRTIAALVCSVAVTGYTAVTFAAGSETSIITNREAHEAVGNLTEQRELSEWLATNTSGRILAQSFENERVIFNVQERVVYEGTPEWEYALQQPAQAGISVIVMRAVSPDGVYEHLHDAAVMTDWKLAHRTSAYVVYVR